MNRISIKVQLILSGLIIIFSLIYKVIFYNELNKIKSVHYFIFYLILSLIVIITNLVSRKHEKKPWIILVACIVALILVSFL
jgi:cell division protein FtsW (lipid II flippase)